MAPRRQTGAGDDEGHRRTLRTVAERAGVSLSTASLAFRGSPVVAAETRDRVLRAAEQLGYAGPDPLARSLRRGRTGVVGAVIGERLRYAFQDPVAVSLLAAVSERLGELESALLLLSADQAGRGPTVEQVAAVPLDAVIFATCGADDEPALQYLLRRGVPVVGVDGPHVPGVVVVDVDDRAGTVELVRYLVALGHERFASVTLPLRLDGRRGYVDPDRREQVVYADCRERLAGLTDVLGADPPTYEAAANLVEEGAAAGRALLTGAGHRPTAVVAQSDLLGVGVVRAAHDLGLRVPEDVSVAGFDGIDTPWLGRSALTTVVQPVEEKGVAVGEIVARLLEGGERPSDVRFPVRLRLGDTTAAAPGRGAPVR